MLYYTVLCVVYLDSRRY